MENSYKYFCNKECQYFPCHKIPEDETFNCLFCFCPLHSFGDKCGGNFSFVKSGDIEIKDCSKCNFPHRASSYDAIMDKLSPSRLLNRKMKDEFLHFQSLRPGDAKSYTKLPGLDSDYDPEPMLLISELKLPIKADPVDMHLKQSYSGKRSVDPALINRQLKESYSD